MDYLVFVAGHDAEPAEGSAVIALTEGLYVIRTDQTRSQLYHALKRRLKPIQLLVAPLSEAPKFMGMRPGALNRLRTDMAYGSE